MRPKQIRRLIWATLLFSCSVFVLADAENPQQTSAPIERAQPAQDTGLENASPTSTPIESQDPPAVDAASSTAPSTSDNQATILETGPVTLIAHEAEYTARIKKGISLNGTATRKLQKLDNENWEYSFIVKTAPADIIEKSIFSYSNDRTWQSQYYSYELTGFFVKDRKQSVSFDRANGQAFETYKDREWTVPVKDTVLDRLNYQLRLQNDVAIPDATLTYEVLHKGKLRTYNFAVLDRQTIVTALGEKQAFVVEKVRDESKKRETTLWFDQSPPYALLKMIQVEDDGEIYEINITSLKTP